jgi:UDP-glucose 4-epimerase
LQVAHLYETIADLTGYQGEPIYMPGRPQEVRLATCSANKARKLLGYETKVDLRHGLQSMIQYISAHGTRKFRYHRVS